MRGYELRDKVVGADVIVVKNGSGTVFLGRQTDTYRGRGELMTQDYEVVRGGEMHEKNITNRLFY